MQHVIVGLVFGLVFLTVSAAVLLGGKSTPKTCGTCRYFQEGACRRYPPVRVTLEQTGFPAPNPDWWCGEHRQR